MSKKKKISLKEKPKELPGISLEKSVARIQRLMDPNSVVTHNEKIADRVGIKRQFDVVIRGTFGGRPILGVIECKDHSRKKGLEQIEAFAKKTENLNANMKLMISRRGFTKSALILATHEGIGCLSLLPSDPRHAGFSIGDMWFGRIYSWKFEQMLIDFLSDKPTSGTFDVTNVKYTGSLVLDWFMKELHTTFSEETETGIRVVRNTFSQPRTIEVDGVDYQVNSIAVVATRVCVKKKKWICWSGDAFYDWHTNMFTIPPQGFVSSSEFDTDLPTWDNTDENIPELGRDELTGFFVAVLSSFTKWKVDVDVVDLSNL